MREIVKDWKSSNLQAPIGGRKNEEQILSQTLFSFFSESFLQVLNISPGDELCLCYINQAGANLGARCFFSENSRIVMDCSRATVQLPTVQGGRCANSTAKAAVADFFLFPFCENGRESKPITKKTGSSFHYRGKLRFFECKN